MKHYKKFKLSKEQKEIIVGKLLGDGHLETVKGITYRLKIEHSYQQKEYVDWLYDKLKDLCPSAPKVKVQAIRGKQYKKYWFNTSYSFSLRFYGKQFYKGRRKIVPKLIDKWLTPLSFAVWFMDDGSIKSKECNGKIINTQSFDNSSLKRLIEAFKKNFGLVTQLRKQKEGKQIYIPASEIMKLNKIIGKHVLPSMRYKLG